jgi:O-antigen ligase
MSLLLLVAAAAVILFSIATIWHRPGFFAGVYLLTYGLAAFFGSIGPVGGAIAIVASLAAINRDESMQTFTLPEYFFLLWMAGQFFSLFTSPNLDVTTPYIASVLLIAGGGYLYARTFAQHPHFFEDLLLSACIITTLCMFQIFRNASGIGAIGESQGLSHVGLAGLPELCMAGIIAFLLFHRGHSWMITLAIIVFAFGVLSPFTLGLGTRSVLLSIGIGLVILLGFRLRQANGLPILTGIAASLATLTAVITIFWYQIAGTAVGRILLIGGLRLLSGSVSGSLDTDRSTLLRLDLYREAWNLFYQAPLLGSGSGSFGYLADNAVGAYPHNMFLEILVQSGLVGLLVFLAFSLPLAVNGLREMLKRPIAWTMAFAVIMMISAFVRYQVSMSITQGKSLFFALGCFAAHQIAERKPPAPANAANELQVTPAASESS